MPSKLNVADVATKRQRGPDAYTQWFDGPNFLNLPPSEWPAKTTKIDEATEELRPRFLYMREEMSRLNYEYYSDWNRLSRAVAYWLVYKEKLIHKIRQTGGATGLRVNHLTNAQRFLYRTMQLEIYADEYAATTKGKSVCRSSLLWRLQLYIDDSGVMCVRDRARRYTSIPMDQVALPPKHWVTKLIVRHYHEKYFHINHETNKNTQFPN